MREGPTVSHPIPAPDNDAAPTPEAIRQQLEWILASATFANAPSQTAMLRYVVELSLAGEADRLKEYTLGVEVFGRGADFDPRQDTIVRVQGRRLRDRLDDYYRQEGVGDPVVISLPKGHYVPAFHCRNVLDIPVSATAEVAPPPLSKLRRWAPTVLVLGGLAVVLMLVATIWLRTKRDTTPPKASISAGARPPPSLAVLPFVDLSQTHDQEYLADGLAEEILNQLAQIPPMRVVGRTSSFSFKNSNEDLRDIGRKLGVAHLLEGSVRRENDRLRITTQLVRADDGSHEWSKTYEAPRKDIFALQDAIARDVATALSVKLDVTTFNREQGGTTNVDAYERYLRWRGIQMHELFDFAHDRERLQLAREMVSLDPQCVLCWDALASSLNAVAGELGGSQEKQLRAEAQQVREHINAIAPDSWIAKRDRANALWRKGKRAQALALSKEVVDSGPLTWERVGDYAFMIFAVGRLEETVAFMEQVRARDPAALFLSRDLQYDYSAVRRFKDAEAEYQRGLQLEGSQLSPDQVAFARQLAGKRPGGLDALRTLHRRLLDEEPPDTPAYRALGNVLHDRGAMLAVVRKVIEDGDEDGLVWAADVADALGDADLTVTAMRKQFETQEGFKEGSMTPYSYVILWIYPYSGVRAHPGFKQLLIETGVADYWRQSGQWGDGCKPVGKEDFECS